MLREMEGKTCLVTGGTSGIGGAISMRLAALGASVTMVARNADKGRAVAEEVRAQTGNPAVDFLEADLLSQRAIREAATRFEKQHKRLDVLVNNVGGAFWKRELTADGVERTLALNLLAPFLMTRALLPLLERSAPSRIVNVATKPRKKDVVDLDDLQMETYNAFGAYGRAKTGLIVYTHELSRRLANRGVTVNSLHPGVATETEFTRDMPRALRLIGPLFARLSGMRVSLDEAAETAVYLASSAAVADLSGEYFVKKQPAAAPPQTYDETVGRGLWEACEALVIAA